MKGKKRFIIDDREHYISKEDIINKFKDVKPKLVRKHYIDVEGKKVGVKQALYDVLNIEKTSFTSSAAISILERLGFESKIIE